MDFPHHHSFDVTTSRAREIQAELRDKLVLTPFNGPIEYIAGVDVSFIRSESLARAVVVIFSFPLLDELECVKLEMKVKFPYVPGLLAFREAPPVLEAFRKVTIRPDVILFDGQGAAHPLGFGLACHLGLLLNVPSIGCAKSRLCGEYVEPGKNKGDFSSLTSSDGRVIGAVLRSRDNTRPLFVSPGYLTDIESSVRIVLSATPRYRIPEPLRAAHRHSKEATCPDAATARKSE